MTMKITLPKKPGVPKIDIEFASQESADYGMAVYLGRMSIPSYNKSMDKLEATRREKNAQEVKK